MEGSEKKKCFGDGEKWGRENKKQRREERGEIREKKLPQQQGKPPFLQKEGDLEKKSTFGFLVRGKSSFTIGKPATIQCINRGETINIGERKKRVI